MTEFFTKLLELIGKASPIRIIHPDEKGVLTRFGKYVASLDEGLHWVLPYLHDIVVLEHPEQVIDLRPQSLTTSDGHTIAVSGAVSYKVVNVQKAMYQVMDFDESIQALSLGIIAHYVNRSTLIECLDAEKLVVAVREGIREIATTKWGLKILNVWITDMAEHTVIRVMGDGVMVPLAV